MTELPILDSRCVTCDAGGWVTNPLWREFHRKQSDAGIKTSDPDYWDGEPDELEEIPCGECDGLGRIPTSRSMWSSDFRISRMSVMRYTRISASSDCFVWAAMSLAISSTVRAATSATVETVMVCISF